jgi:hypothetical protein
MGFLLGAAMLGAVAFAGVFLFVAVVLKTVFWAVTLPIRLVFGLLFFPIWLARTALRAVGLLILAPILAAGGVLVAGAILVAGLLAVVVPLLPILVIGFLLWIVIRSFSHSAVPAA